MAEQHKVRVETETRQLGMTGHKVFLERVPGARVGHKNAFALELYGQGCWRFFEEGQVMRLRFSSSEEPGSMVLEQDVVMVALNDKSLSLSQQVHHFRLKAVLVNQVAYAEESIDIAHGRQSRPQPRRVAVNV
jgi:hypothetical protein